MAVIGTSSTSAAATAVAPVVSPKNTVVKAADCEDTIIAESISVAVAVFFNFAESEARNLDPLLKMLACDAPELAPADNGEDGEGREVVIVSRIVERLAASTD